MDSVLSIGFAGLRNGISQVVDSSQRVVEAFTPESANDGADAIVSLIAAEHQVYASTAVIRTGKSLQKSILDILA